MQRSPHNSQPSENWRQRLSLETAREKRCHLQGEKHKTKTLETRRKCHKCWKKRTINLGSYFFRNCGEIKTLSGKMKKSIALRRIDRGSSLNRQEVLKKGILEHQKGRTERMKIRVNTIDFPSPPESCDPCLSAEAKMTTLWFSVFVEESSNGGG